MFDILYSILQSIFFILPSNILASNIYIYIYIYILLYARPGLGVKL